MSWMENIKFSPAELPRKKTDALFGLWNADMAYSGTYDRAVRFAMEHQSKNALLWKNFVAQFKLQNDSNDGGWSGEFFGKMMRGACWIYHYTKDAELYAVLEDAAKGLLQTAEADGRISSYKRDKEFTYWDMWCRKYVLLGLEYFMEISENEVLKREIIAVLCRHLDYIMEHIGEGEGKIDILDATTANSWTWGALNSSSILEPVVRLYSLTGEKKYLDFASYLVRRGGSKWGNIYKLALQNEKNPCEYPVTKAYEATSYFEGVLEYYRVTGDENAKTAYLNYISRVLETDFTIIGCAGTMHELFNYSSLVQTEFNETVKQETCVTVTLMKAFYQALCLTGDAKYADAMERAGYNAMLGSINFEKNTEAATDERWDEIMAPVLPFLQTIGGFTFDAYAPLYKEKRNRRVGGFRRMEGGATYGCCACIGGAGVALMPLSAIMVAEDGLRINHLMSGAFSIGEVALQIETAYPYGESAVIRVLSAPGEEMTIGIRIPSFAAGKMTVDGEIAVANEKGYAIIRRAFKTGEEIRLQIPRTLTLHKLNGKYALTNGAIVFALDERIQDVNVKIGGEILRAEKIATEFASREAFAVEFTDGQTIRFVDFASAGSQWNHEKSLVSVWIDGTEEAKKKLVNPIAKGWYADPESRVYGDTVYMYVTHSRPFEEQKNLSVFYSKDLETFECAENILDMQTFKGADFAIWAPSVVKKNGRYYIIFAANNIHEDGEPGGLYVGESESPIGPFRNVFADGRALINVFHFGAQPIDAHFYQEGDDVYLYYGGWGHLVLCRMSEDMKSYTDPQEITPADYVEAPYVMKERGKYLLMYSSGNWMDGSYRVLCACASAPCGPFVDASEVLGTSEIACGAGHNSAFYFKGKHYVAYHRRLHEDKDPHHRILCVDEMQIESEKILPITMT